MNPAGKGGLFSRPGLPFIETSRTIEKFCPAVTRRNSLKQVNHKDRKDSASLSYPQALVIYLSQGKISALSPGSKYQPGTYIDFTTKTTKTMDQETTGSEKKTLYEKLGGEPGLRELIDEIIDRIADNTFLEYYFRNIDKGMVRILAYEYFSMKSGGPDRYTGQPVHSAFYSLNPRPEEFEYAMEDVALILDEKGIGQTERVEFMEILEDLRADVLRAKSV
jgi:hemoglobin